IRQHTRSTLFPYTTLFRSQVRGLVIANDGDITPAMVIQLEAVKLPLVLIENHISGHQLPCILGDNFMAGYTIMRHLLDLGHRAIDRKSTRLNSSHVAISYA